jgi:chemotaxis protein CheZ
MIQPTEGASGVATSCGETSARAAVELAACGPSVATAPPGEDVVLAKVAQISRTLYESLQALGLDDEIRDSLAMVPHVDDRLGYIQRVGEDAATRTLNSVDCARSGQESLGGVANALSEQWTGVFAQRPCRETFIALLADTRGLIRSVPEIAEATNRHLTDILMAQSFQDLTGQVLRRVSEVVMSLEAQLANLLMDSITPERRAHFAANIIVQISARSEIKPVAAETTGAGAVMENQVDVDDLLSSLGF